MDDSLRTAASGMMAQQRMVDVIANNLANVNTTGFKRSRVNFEDVLYETLRGERVAGQGEMGSTGPVQIGKGVRIASVMRLDAQGSPETTQRPLDIAIEGDGYLQVQRPDGTTAFTRDGNLTLSESGALVTSNGNPVVPGISIPQDATSITISPSGVVSVTASGSSNQVEVGRIELARFLNPAGLSAIGENQLVATDSSGEPIVGTPQEDGFGRVTQGALEASNVEIVQEMTDMIAAQRAYEINAKAIKAGEDMMTVTNEILR
jgi:flagellar basal-body rod protein FlgG